MSAHTPLTAWEERVRSMSDEEHEHQAVELGAEIKLRERELDALKERRAALDSEITSREFAGGKTALDRVRAVRAAAALAKAKVGP